MPLPKPNQGESHQAFVNRCMGDSVMTTEFDDMGQRRAVCERQWGGVTAMSSAFICSGSLDSVELARTTVAGQPAGRFKKTIIRVGEYVKQSSGQKISVSPSMLSHWAETFAQMKSNGVKVPIPSMHGGHGDPDKNRGYVDKMRVVGDRLEMECTLVGEDGLRAAARSDVSIYSPPEWTDSGGNRYEQPILHVALCTDPVVPGLGDFVEIAASQGDSPMGLDLKKIGKAFGIEKFDESKAEEMLLSRAEEYDEMLSSLTDEVEDLKKKVVSLSEGSADDKKKKTKPDPLLLNMAADNRTMKLDGLVAAGRISPACRDKLKDVFIGKNNAAIELSISSGTVDDFDKVVAALSENKPVKTGEMTGAQLHGGTAVLSDASKGDENPMLAECNRRAKAGMGK